MFLTGFIFGLLVFNSFTANIISSLATSRSLNSIEELLNYGKMRLDKLATSAQFTFLILSHNSLIGSSFPPFTKVIQDSEHPLVSSLHKYMQSHEETKHWNEEMKRCYREHNDSKYCDKRVVDVIARGNRESTIRVSAKVH